MTNQTDRRLFVTWILLTFACIGAICCVDPNLFAGDYAAKVRADNPVVYWRFEETSGSTAFEAIKGLNGTYQNVTLGKQSAYSGLGKAAEFNGLNSTVRVPAVKSFGAISIEAWVKPETLAVANYNSIYNTDNGHSHWQIYDSTFEWALAFSDSNNLFRFYPGKWYHIVTTYSSTVGDAYLYVNGELKERLFASNPGKVTQLNAGYFGSWLGTDRFFHGLIDEVAVYDSVLTPTQIASHYDLAWQSQDSCVPGMQAWWKGENNVSDSAGNNHGNNANVTFITGKVGQAFQFNGVNSYIEVPQDEILDPRTGSFSIEGWIQTTASGRFALVDKNECGPGCSSNANSAYHVYVAGGAIGVQLRDSTGQIQELNGNMFVADGSFHHFAIVRDIANVRLSIYVDGLEDASQALNITGSIRDDDAQADPLLIGARILNGVSNKSDFFNGVIDELSFYRGALTPAEIAAIYNAGSYGKCANRCAKRPNGLRAWYAAESNADDKMNNYAGTLQNGVSFTAGRVQNAFRFDGVDDYVSAPLSYAGPFTVEFWAKPTSISQGLNTALVSSSSPGNYASRFQIEMNGSGGYIFQAGNDVLRLPIGDATTFWQHIAVTYDGLIVRSYLNGRFANAASWTGNVLTFDLLKLGVNRDQNRFFNGALDEVTVYNRALNADEIVALFNSGSSGKCDTVEVTISSPSQVCSGQSVTLDAGNFAQYLWSTGATTRTVTVSPAQSTTYSVDVIADDGAHGTDTHSVTVQPTPAIPTAGNNGPGCEGSTITLSASTSTTLVVSFFNMNDIADNEQLFLNGTQVSTVGYAGSSQSIDISQLIHQGNNNIRLVANNGNGTWTYGFEIRKNGTVIFRQECGVAGVSGCNNNDLTTGTVYDNTITVSVNPTYNWTGPDGVSVTTTNLLLGNVTLAKGGQYSVTATENGCRSDAATTAVVVNATPNPPVVTNNGPLCEGALLSLTASDVPGAGYSWTGPNGFTSNAQKPTIPGATSANAGSYIVGVTVNGCASAQASTTVVINAVPSAPIAGNNGPLTKGAPLNLTASTIAGASYSWSGPNGFTANVQNPTIQNASISQTGIYSVTATVNGCTSATGSTSVSMTDPNGLVSYWPGDGNADDVEDGNDGTLFGAASFDSNRKKVDTAAFRFSSSGDYIEIPDSTNSNLDVVEAITLSAWIYIPSPFTKVGFDNSYVIDKKNHYSLLIRSDRHVRFLLNYFETPLFLDSADPISLDQWHHLAVTYDRAAGEAKVYLDGVLNGEAAYNLPILTDNRSLRIGCFSGFSEGEACNSGWNFPGWIDEVKLHNRALTPQEINQEYRGFVAYWPEDGDANDVIGGHNPSASNNPNFVAGKIGSGVNVYPGGYIEILDQPSLENQRFTVSAWVRPDGPGPNDDQFGSKIVGKELPPPDGNNAGSLGLWWSAQGSRFRFSVENNSNTVSSANQFLPGQFYHVAGSYDRNKLRLYVNGHLEAERTLDIPVPYDPAVPWSIGSTHSFYRSIGFPRTFNGVIDEVRLAPRALTQAEIQQMMALPSCVPVPDNGLRNWYPAEGNAIDLQNQSNGTLNNGASFAQGAVGKAFNLDGIDDYVSAPVSYTGPFTVEFWAKPATVSQSAYTALVSSSGAGNYASSFQIELNGTGKYVFQAGNDNLRIEIGDAISDWQHIAVSYDGSVVRTYLNGRFANAGNWNGSTLAFNVLKLGVNRDQTKFFHGSIDEVTIFTRALEEGEIMSVANAGTAGKCVGEPISHSADAGGPPVTASTAPQTDGNTGGATATLTNNTAGSGTATVTVQNLASNPEGFQLGNGVYVDVKAIGVDSSDSMLTKFYYPQTANESTLVLKYFDKTAQAFIDVKNSGGTQPLKDITNNLDGTVSGGRFTVTFDATSTPPITGLTGTVFVMAGTSIEILLTSSLNPSQTGQPVAFTATISDNISGSISFKDNGQEIGSPQVQSGQALFTTSGLSVGEHPITAVYVDSNSNVSVSPSLMQVVEKSPTAITVTSSANPMIKDQPLTFIATVSTPNTNAPPISGTVVFTENGTEIGSASLQQNRQAALNVSGPFAVGSHNIIATYSGDSNFNSSSSQVFTEKVIYNFSGFFQPVDNNGVYNSVKVGSAIPVKFSLSGYQGMNIFAANYPGSLTIICSTGTIDVIEEVVSATQNSLTYDGSTDKYNYVWKTDKSWAGNCRKLVVRLNDGTDHEAYFKFTK